MEKWIDYAPDSRESVIARARLRSQQEAWDEAAADWAKAIELSATADDWNAPRKRLCRELAGLPEAFSRVAELMPQESTLWIARGQHHAQCSQWSAAVSDLARVFQTGPLSDEAFFEYACALRLVGDEQGYQDICQRLVAQTADSGDSRAQFILARTCGMRPATSIDPEQIVQWAARRVEEDDSQWSLHVLGLAQYRAGELEKALETFTKSNTGSWHDSGKAQNWLLQAMAYWRLEDCETARRWLQRAQREIDAAMPENPDQPTSAPPPDWVELNLLRREAEALIDVDGEPNSHQTEADEPTTAVSDQAA